MKDLYMKMSYCLNVCEVLVMVDHNTVPLEQMKELNSCQQEETKPQEGLLL